MTSWSAMEPMRRAAWGLVVGGLVIAVVYFFYSIGATRANERAWHEEGLRSTNMAELNERVRMANAGLVPKWTQVSAWPGVLFGFAMSGLGMVLLAIRPPGIPPVIAAASPPPAPPPPPPPPLAPPTPTPRVPPYTIPPPAATPRRSPFEKPPS
jgi:hypothetical protein